MKGIFLIDRRHKPATVQFTWYDFVIHTLFFFGLGMLIAWAFIYGFQKEVEYQEELQSERCMNENPPAYC